MAMALLPIFVLSLIQTQADFQRQADDRQVDLQLAAERSASSAKAQLDSAQVLLRALSPDAVGPYCAPRLTALVGRLEGYEGLYRISPTGEAVCASGRADGVRSGVAPAAQSTWFQRLRNGEELVVMRAPDGAGYEGALIVATRAERPMGRFDGAMVAVIPFSALQPDVTDPALPSGAQAALTDGAGRILTASDPDVFKLSAGDDIAGWVDRASDHGSAVFEAKDAQKQRRDYAGAALAGGDLYALLSAPAPGWLSWARLNPIGTLLLPLGAWLTAFAAVMLLSERIFIRWLDYLERVAGIYAKGRFSVRPLQAMNAPSEIRTMARTLDEMAEAITLRDRELTDALMEKDALMREIHHRVKNNLQTVAALLRLQARRTPAEDAKAALEEAVRRVGSIAIVHETLSHAVEETVDFDEIADRLGSMVVDVSGVEVPVRVVREGSFGKLPSEAATPLAMVLTELLQNAVEHGYAGVPAETSGRVVVTARHIVGRLHVVVEDDGRGLPDDFDLDSSTQLGLSIVRTLVESELGGVLEIGPGSRGTRVQADLPVD